MLSDLLGPIESVVAKGGAHVETDQQERKNTPGRGRSKRRPSISSQICLASHMLPFLDFSFVQWRARFFA